MEVKIEQNQDSYREALFSITPDEMEKYLNEASEKLSRNMNIKGFREGKIPRKVVEKSVGEETVWHEASRYAMEDNYWKAIKNEKIEPIGMPKIEVLKIVPGNNFEFRALIPVMPNLDLPDYKSIARKIKEKEHKTVTVDEKEVRQSLEWLQRSRANMSQKDGPSRPRQAEAEKEPEIPEINDEFAQGLGDFKDLISLKESLKEGLAREKENQEKQRIRLRMLEEIRKNIKFDVPDFLIEQEIDKMQNELEQQVESMDMTLEDYVKKAGKSLQEVRDGWKEKALERIGSGIILEIIAKKEDIKLTEEEIEKEAAKYLQQFKDSGDAESQIDPERLKAYISGIMKNEKVFELLEQ